MYHVCNSIRIAIFQNYSTSSLLQQLVTAAKLPRRYLIEKNKVTLLLLTKVGQNARRLLLLASNHGTIHFTKLPKSQLCS